MQPQTPSIARVHDASPDGAHHVEVDRALQNEILRTAPELRRVALAIRTWRARVVRHLAAETGITQFLDIGSVPAPRASTHHVAQGITPGATVVHVGPDPAADPHSHNVVRRNERVSFAAADPTRPDEVFACPAVREHLDLRAPVALLHCTALHHVPDEQDPAAIMTGYVAGLATGSHVALAHWWDPEDEGIGTSLARRIESIHRSSNAVAAARYRTRAEIEALFDGLELLPPTAEAPPSLAPLHRWWPDGAENDDPPLISRLVLGGLARKP